MVDAARNLIERASRGEATAVEALLQKHLPDLERYVRARAGRLIAERESRSDLVQSVCREILTHVERFRYDGEEGFRRWLFATALRKLRDRQRYWGAEKREARREVGPAARPSSASAAELVALLGTDSTPSRRAVARDERERMERALHALPERHREIVRLAYFEELPHAEIARRLGISEANARMLLSRSLARLARLLAP